MGAEGVLGAHSRQYQHSVSGTPGRSKHLGWKTANQNCKLVHAQGDKGAWVGGGSYGTTPKIVGGRNFEFVVPDSVAGPNGSGLTQVAVVDVSCCVDVRC